MTEQISKLALQCGAWHQVYGNRNFMIDEHFDINKFAQLIVRECIDIASQEDFDVMMKEGYPCSQTAKKIQEHFGVEE
jgi:hypothetical protein